MSTPIVSCYLAPVKNIKDTFVTILPEKCNTPHFDSTVDGIWKIYSYDSLTLLEITSIKHGLRNGSDVIYCAKGTVKKRATYKKGELSGNYISYFEDGKIEMKGNYKPGNRIGLELFTGEETKFWDNGNIAYKAIWKSGWYKSEKYWDKDGKEINEDQWRKLWYDCN